MGATVGVTVGVAVGTVVGSAVGVSGDISAVISVATDVGSVTSDGLSFLEHPVKQIMLIIVLCQRNFWSCFAKKILQKLG